MKRQSKENNSSNKKQKYDELKFPEAYSISQDIDKLVEFLMEKKAIKSEMKCDCGAQMSLNKRKDRSDIYYWRCKCKREKSIRSGSFFEKSKLALSQLFLFTFLYLKFDKILSKYIAEIADISEQKVVDWGNLIREEISYYFLKNPLILGENSAVQIDESLFGGRRKYNRGFFRII